MTRHGSLEHFSQVVNAHTLISWDNSWGTCRCGARVERTEGGYRAHIAKVWRPYELPETF